MRHRSLPPSVWIALLLLVLYPLSIGPAAWVSYRYPSTGRVTGVLYRPLLFAAEEVPALDYFLVWYLYTVWHIEKDAL